MTRGGCERSRVRGGGKKENRGTRNAGVASGKTKKFKATKRQGGKKTTREGERKWPVKRKQRGGGVSKKHGGGDRGGGGDKQPAAKRRARKEREIASKLLACRSVQKREKTRVQKFERTGDVNQPKENGHESKGWYVGKQSSGGARERGWEENRGGLEGGGW